MALPLGKLTILLGAGLVGSVLAKEGRLPNVTDFFSGAFKIALNQIKRGDDSSSSSGKPRNDSLLAQVNSLREELQLLASNRPVTIITGSRAGASIGAPVVIVIVVGSGYIWWKGWKLSDMMFATRRSLSDACTSVGKQLEQVFSSITVAEKKISSRITQVDGSIDECKILTEATRDEVSKLRGDVGSFSEGVQTVHRAVKTLETKIGRIEGKQDLTTDGVLRLCDFVKTLENSRTAASIQASPSISRAALELPQTTPTPRVLMQTRSLHRGLSLEPSSPSIQVTPSNSSSAAPELPQIMTPSKNHLFAVESFITRTTLSIYI